MNIEKGGVLKVLAKLRLVGKANCYCSRGGFKKKYALIVHYLFPKRSLRKYFAYERKKKASDNMLYGSNDKQHLKLGFTGLNCTRDK